MHGANGMAGQEKSGETRVAKVSAANIKNSTLSVRGLADFLPADCVGPNATEMANHSTNRYSPHQTIPRWASSCFSIHSGCKSIGRL